MNDERLRRNQLSPPFEGFKADDDMQDLTLIHAN